MCVVCVLDLCWVYLMRVFLLFLSISPSVCCSIFVRLSLCVFVRVFASVCMCVCACVCVCACLCVHVCVCACESVFISPVLLVFPCSSPF